jgi:WD40 repeat protein
MLCGTPVLKRHTGRVGFLAFSPDGSVVLSAGEEDMSVRVWDVGTGELLQVFVTGSPGYFHFVRRVAFSPDGSQIYAVSEEEKDWICAWKWPGGDPLYRVQVRGMLCRGLSSGGQFAALQKYRGEQQYTYLFDLREARLLPLALPPDAKFEAIAPDGSLLLSWESDDYTTCRWALHHPTDSSVAYESTSSNSHTLLSVQGQPMLVRLLGGEDEKVTLQFLDKSYEEVRFECPHDRPHDFINPDRMQFEPGTNLLMRCHIHAPGEVLDLARGETVAKIDPGTGYDTVLAASPDGQRVAIGDASGSVRLVSTSSWQVERTIRGMGHTVRVAISSDGRYLAMVRGKGRDSVWLWDLEHLQLIGPMTLPEDTLPSSPRMWSAEVNGEPLVYLPDLQWLGYLGSAAHQWIENANHFGVEAGRFREQFSRDHRAITQDGRWLALVEHGAVKVADLRANQIVHQLPLEIENDSWCRVDGIAISPDGRKAAVGLTMVENDVLVCDFARKRITERKAYSDFPDSLSFDPKGRYLAVGCSHDNDVHLRPITRGVKRRRLSGHHQSIRSLAFAPNGHLVSSGDDGRVIVWDGDSFEQRATLTVFDEPFGWAAFTPQGKIWGSSGVEREFVPRPSFPLMTPDAPSGGKFS